MWLRPQGYAVIKEDGKRDREANSMTCAHCCRITHIPAKCDPADLGGFCTVCSSLICAQCVGKGCDPLEEKLRRMEARDAALRSYGG